MGKGAVIKANCLHVEIFETPIRKSLNGEMIKKSLKRKMINSSRLVFAFHPAGGGPGTDEAINKS